MLIDDERASREISQPRSGGLAQRREAPVVQPQLPRFELAEWVHEHEARVKHNFGSSGIEAPDLQEAEIDADVAGFYRKHHGDSVGLEKTIAETYHVDNSSVLVTSSSSEALYLLHQVLLKEGDDVVAPSPNYPAELKLPEVVGAHLRTVPVRFEEKWQLSLDRVAEAVGKKTRLVSVTNSHNPTGIGLQKHALEQLVELTDENGSWLLVDEAFREYGFDRAAPTAATLGEHVISTGTMSKFYGLEDIRIGWILADSELVARLRSLKEWITSVNSRFGEYVAKQVLENHKWFVERARKFMTANLPSVKDFMNKCDTFRWVEPDAAPFCFPRLNSAEPSIEFCRRLMREDGILLDPGFYLDGEGYVRLCFTRSPEKVQAGLAALKKVLSVS